MIQNDTISLKSCGQAFKILTEIEFEIVFFLIYMIKNDLCVSQVLKFII